MRLFRLGLLFVSLLCAVGAFAQQSNNTALHAVPAPGNMVIDGKLDDWDLSGQIDVYANYRMKNSYSAKVAAMWDKDNYYLCVLWRDPTPMYNMVDSNFDIGSGWKSDCLQLRLKTDMVIGDVTCWYSTAAKHPVVNIAYGRFTGGRDKETDVNAFQSLTDALKDGAQEAFTLGEDGKSYTQEIALPWRLITGQSAIVKATGKAYRAPKTYGAGDTFNMGMEFLWGPADGKTFPIHRYADLLMPGKSSREFFWTAENDWGPVTLEPKGHLKPASADAGPSTEYLQKTQGPVKLQYTMPYDGFVTLVVDDAQGHRVKNILGMAPRNKGKQTDYWDGTTEDGKLAVPGAYHWRGLFHQGVDPTYEASYGTPGTPPWDNAEGSGAWMSDHTCPVAVAVGGNTVLMAASGSEGGWALIGTDLTGKKKWGQRKFQAISALAADDTYAYAAMDSAEWAGQLTPTVGRCLLTDGSYAPFATDKGPQLIVDVAPAAEQAHLTGIAVGKDTLTVALAGPDVLRTFDKKTMAPKGDVPLAQPGALAVGADGTLYAISGARLVKMVDGKPTVLVDGLDHPAGLTVDAQGRLYVTEQGAAMQVRVIAANGTTTIGTKGGRPQPGTWDPQGMRNPRGLAVDGQGRLWVAENDMWPKRVSVWGADGKLVRDYIGPTTYGGMGAVADPADKTRVFGNGCEFKLDYAANTAVVKANVLTENLVGDLVKFQGREYYENKQGQLYLRKGDALVPVAQFGQLRPQDIEKSGIPVTAPAGVRDWFGYLWCDLNDDGKMSANEVAATTTVIAPGGWGGQWTDERFDLYSAPGGYYRQIVTKIPLKGFTPGGAPIWDLHDLKQIADWPAPGPNKLFLATKGTVIVGTPLTCYADDGTRLWTYSRDMWNDVHGSHLAPIPERDDQFVGVLSCCGVANTPLGKVFAMNSNMGRLYVMTADGLLVATVFQDCRIGSDPWPTSAKPGSPMGGVTMGGEWFGGYFFKSEATNEFYLIAGGTSYNLIKLNGLEKVQALPGGALTMSGKDLLAAERLQQQRAAAAATAQTLTITRLTAPKVDGRLDKYPEARRIAWNAGPYGARAALGVDDANLYVAIDVNGDNNPMVNSGKDPSLLFITGDCVDLQLGTDPAADPKRGDAALGDIRVSISVLDGKPIAVLYRFKANGAKHPQVFSSPWRKFSVDDVEVLGDAKIVLNRRGDGYGIEAALPLAALGFTPQPGKAYKCDVGVIFSDPTGTTRAARVYWANKATGLVNDVPGEIMPTPQLWGTATVEK